MLARQATDEPYTGDELDLLEQWSASLVAYSARAWKLCGDEVTP